MSSPRYEVNLLPAAARSLRKLDTTVQKQIVAVLSELADDPRPTGVKALSGHPGKLRVRSGNYRVVYTIDDGKLTVLVVAVGHRSRIYRGL